MKNNQEMETSHKIKRLKRIREEEEVRKENDQRFAEEFSEEPMTEEQLAEDLPDEEI